MRLTTQAVERFKGGEIEIQNQGEGYLYRGKVATIVVEDNELHVKLAWSARGEGYPPFPKRWVKDDHLNYAVSLEICEVKNIGPSSDEIGGGDRLWFDVWATGETMILFPPDGSKLDPAKIEEL